MLWLALVLCCVVGLVTPYLLGFIGLALLVALILRRQLVAAYRDLAARLFALAFLVLGICYAITARAPQDVLLVFNFTALILFGAFLALAQRNARADAVFNVARLAALGVAIALIAAVVGRYALGFERAESPIFGAILLGNTAVLLGFIAVIGIFAAPSPRWSFLLVPLLGVATAAITASRGPMLAVAPLVVLCAVVVARRFKIRAVIAIPATLAYLAACALLLFGLDERLASIFGIAGAIAEGETVTDTNASIRLAFYQAGLRAFLDAPIFGHGWARLMTSIEPYLAEDMRQYLWLPQLHNDVINLGVAAGIVGVAVYVLLIATPLVAAWRSPRDALYLPRMVGCAILCTAYVFDGLTDLMFGFEFHTMLYVVLSAILLGYCREPVQAT